MQLIPNSKKAPDGTFTAYTFSGEADDTTSLERLVTTPAGLVTFSIFLRSDSPQKVRMFVCRTSDVCEYLNINTTRAWTRYHITTTVDLKTLVGLTGTELEEAFLVEIWGADLKAGQLSSYIPTEHSVAVRAADVILSSPTLNSTAPKGADSVFMNTVAGQVIRVGAMFGISGLLLQCSETVIATSTVTEVKIVNRLRKSLPSGSQVKFNNPKIRWRLNTDSQVRNVMGYTGPVTLSFSEDI